MATPKTLKSRIDSLFNALGGPHKPTTAKIRSELSTFAILAESLEDGQATAEKEATIAALKTEIENLQVELKSAKADIKRFQAEQKKQDEKEREMPPIQFKILSRLPSRNSGKPLKVEAIAQAVSIPVDEADVHINKLKEAGLVIAQYNNFAPTVWHRSNTGNALVIARRLAGEEDQQPHKYPNLPPIQHEILLLIAAGENDGGNENAIAETLGKTLGLVRHNLNALEAADMAGDLDQPDYGAGRTFYLRDTGADYLAERDLL